MFVPFSSNAKGNVTVLFSVSSVVILLAAGAAVDYSHLADATVAVQAALDSAVLSCAAAGQSTAIDIR